MEFLQHAGAAAQHGAVGLPIQHRKSDVVEKLARRDQVGDPTAIAERLAGNGRIVDEFIGEKRSEQFVLPKVLDQALAVGQFRHLAATVGQNNRFIGVVDIWILDQTCERRKASAGRKQQQPLSRYEVSGNERARWLTADQNLIAFPYLLQAGR